MGMPRMPHTYAHYAHPTVLPKTAYFTHYKSVLTLTINVKSMQNGLQHTSTSNSVVTYLMHALYIHLQICSILTAVFTTVLTVLATGTHSLNYIPEQCTCLQGSRNDYFKVLPRERNKTMYQQVITDLLSLNSQSNPKVVLLYY